MDEKDRQTLIDELQNSLKKSLENNLNNKLTEELATGLYSIIGSQITQIIKQSIPVEEDNHERTPDIIE